MNLVEAYRNYLDYEDKKAEEYLIYELYKQTQFWLQNGYPDHTFLVEFIELALEFEDDPFSPDKLLDLGLNELIDALNFYNGLEKNMETMEKHLKQALMSFLAWIDEKSYRKIKAIQFFELDFRIFNIIGGEFPHESAQIFLKSTNEVDIWLVIRYLEEIEEDNIVIDILESLLQNIRTLPEKYMLLAYLILRYPDLIRALFNHDVKKDIYFPTLPSDIHYEELHSIFRASETFLFYGELEMNFYEKILHPKYESVVLLALLTMFEITNPVVTPEWIEVFERSMGNLWSYKYKIVNTYKKHEPLPEFSVNLITFLTDEEQKYIYETSKIFIIFFDNIHRYSKQTFEELSDLLSLQTEIFEEELKYHLYLASKSKFVFRRLQECASKIYKKIIKKGNQYELIDIEEI